jgi:hypothetical protein
MALKGIAVLVDSTPEGDDRVRLAATIAQRHGARLIGFYVARNTSLFHSFVRGHCAIQSMIERCMLSRDEFLFDSRRDEVGSVVQPFGFWAQSLKTKTNGAGRAKRTFATNRSMPFRNDHRWRPNLEVRAQDLERLDKVRW